MKIIMVRNQRFTNDSLSRFLTEVRKVDRFIDEIIGIVEI
jgi:hypothetical protein